MKLTKSQQNELVVWEHFMPDNVTWQPKTDQDLKMFFEWSERGLHRDRQMVGDFSYFEALRQGKRWAGINIHEMFEEGVLDGSMPYFVILGGYEWLGRKRWWQFWKKQTFKPLPRQVVDFMKKEMFKGHDADLIEKVYQGLS